MTSDGAPRDTQGTGRPGSAHLAGYVFPSRWRTPRSSNYEVALWLTDDGILVGSPDWDTVDGSSGSVRWPTRTRDPVDRERAQALAAADEDVTFITWDQVRSATVTEHHLTPHRLDLVLSDGTDRTVWRAAPSPSGPVAEPWWRALVDRLAEEVPETDISIATEDTRRWYHRLLSLKVIVPLFVALAVAIAANLLMVNRLYDAPLERWAAGDYDGDVPVAVIFADSAAALPLPYWIADPPPFWILDDDTIMLIQRGGRYGPDRCVTLTREGDRLQYERQGRLPCVHPGDGRPLEQEAQVRIADVLDGETVRPLSSLELGIRREPGGSAA